MLYLRECWADAKFVTTHFFISADIGDFLSPQNSQKLVWKDPYKAAATTSFPRC